MKQLFKRGFSVLLCAAVLAGMLLVPSAAAAEKKDPVEPVSMTYINPRYKDVVQEDDLVKPDADDRLKPQTVTPDSVEEFYTDPFSAAEYVVRPAFKARSTTVEVGVALDTGEEAEVQQAMEDVIAATLIHTGVPDEGDYLGWNVAGCYCTADGVYADGIYFWIFTYTVTYYTTAEQEARMNTEVDALLDSLDLDGKDTYTKLKAVYDYICSNVAYDHANLDDESYTLKFTAYAALVNKTAVCQGYSSLLYRLALELGIDARIIRGYGAGTVFYNIIQMDDGLYYIANAAVDAGKSKYSCFLVNRSDHYRDYEYDSDEFHAAYPMSKTDYFYDPDANVYGEGTCGENAVWKLEKGVLTVSGTGDMADYSGAKEQPWYAYRESITSVVVKGSVNRVGAYAFCELKNLNSVVIEEGVTELGTYALRWNYNLSSVTLPSSVTAMGRSVFSSCTNLTSAGPVGSGCDLQFGWTEAIPDYAFESMSGLYSVTLPDTMISVGSRAFQLCSGLKEVDLNEGLQKIGDYAFMESGLESIVLPGSVTLGQQVFVDCWYLKSVTLQEGILTIPAWLFERCSELRSITLPASVKYVDTAPFSRCSNMTSVTFLGDAPEICTDAFMGQRLTVQYPAANTTWKSSVMQDYMGNLTWMPYYNSEVASGWSGDLNWVLTDCGTLIFYGQGNMKNYNSAADRPWNAYAKQIKRVILTEGATKIGNYAFHSMDALTTIVIPETVTTIGDYAFKNCTALDGVDLPSNLSALGESAFYGCTALTAIDIPASLYTVKPYTFKNCTSLANVTFREGNLMKLCDGAFYNTALTQVTFPACLDIIDNYCFKNCAGLASITIPEGDLTQIREAVFYGSAIDSMVVPEGVTKVGPYAFKNCTKLVSVQLPTTLTSVGEASFYACTALKSVEIPDAVTTIGNYAFRRCTALTEVDLGSALMNIGESSFYGCTGLKTLQIPNQVAVIQAYAFKGCTGVTAVTLPDSLTTLGDSAFHTCTGLSSIAIPVNVKTIGEYCFSGSTGINSISFTGNAPSIGTGAFNKLAATASYPGGNATWTADVMQNYGGTITWEAA